MKNLLLIALIAGFAVSCGNKDKNSEGSTEQSTDDQLYSVNYKNTTLEWEAYKTSAKIGVKGSFDSINIQSEVEKGSLVDIMNSTSFQIQVSSTNSANEIRDPKIVNSFFGSMLNTEFIKGSLSNFKQTDSTSGQVTVSLTMNDKTQDLTGMLSFDGRNIKLEAVVDMANWEAIPSVDSLNKVCEDLHKGEDGTSVLWPDVKITVSTSYYPVNPDA